MSNRFYPGQSDYVDQLNAMDDALAAATSPTKASVGLGNVDNTSDVNKPVSTAQQTALNLKQDTSGKNATGGYAGLTGFKLQLPNNAGTFTSTLENTNTAARTYVMPNVSGTVALTSDIVTYTLPTASSSVLGGIKIGSGLSIDGAGVVSAASGYTLPIAGASTLGGVKVGSGLSIDGAGVLTATGATSGTVTSVNSITPVTGNVTITTANISENTNLYFTAARVLASVLTGLSTATNAVITASDTVLSALGKLQKQITDRNPTVPLSVSKTGSFINNFRVVQVAPVPFDDLLGSTITPPTGKAVRYINYNEAVLNSNQSSLLQTVSFTDLVQVHDNVIFNLCSKLTSISFPALTSIVGQTNSAGNSQAFQLTNLTALTTISVPVLETVIGNGIVFGPNLPALSTIDMPLLKYVNSISIFNTVACTSFTAASLISVFRALALDFSGGSVTSFSLPALVSVGDSVSISGTPSVTTSISLAALTYVGGTFTFNGSGMASVTLTNLADVGGLFSTNGNMVNLTTLSLPAIVRLSSGISLTPSAGGYTTITFGSTLKHVGGDVIMTNLKLTQSSVDGILASLAALDGTSGTTTFGSGRTVNLSGGTSSTPSSTGLASKAVLTGRGVTVTHN